MIWQNTTNKYPYWMFALTQILFAFMSIIVVLSKQLVVHTITNKLHLLNSSVRNERTDRKFNFIWNRHFEVGKKIRLESSSHLKIFKMEISIWEMNIMVIRCQVERLYWIESISQPKYEYIEKKFHGIFFVFFTSP